MHEENNKMLLMLLSDLKSGNMKAFPKLLDIYLDSIYTFFFRLTLNPEITKELTRRLFNFVLNNVHQIRMNVPFAKYLHAISLQIFLEEYRLRKENGDFTDFMVSANEIRDTHQTIFPLDAALSRLHQVERILLILSDFERYSWSEINDMFPEVSIEQMPSDARDARRKVIESWKR